MFVDKRHHKKRIASNMFNFVLEEAKRNEKTQITVNSSPYAVKVYESWGFVKTGEQQEKDGIIFTPMARAL
jgi:predicted GNAT family N-acyltransferase